MSCEDCPLRSGRTRVPSKGPGKKYCVIGEAPGASELRQGEPFVGQSGDLLKRTLTAAGINPKDVFYTNACSCFTPVGDKSKNKIVAEAAAHCNQRLYDELEAKKPHSILVAGQFAWDAIKSDASSLMQTRGLGYYNEALHANVVVTVHPAACLRMPAFFCMFAEDVEKFSLLPRKPLPVQNPHIDIYVPTNIRQAQTMLKRVPRGAWTAIDCETTSREPQTGRILCIGVGWDDQVIILRDDLLKSAGMLISFQHLINQHTCTVGHNAKFDAGYMKYHLGIDWPWHFDTMLGHYLINEAGGADDTKEDRGGGGAQMHNLKLLARYHYNQKDYAIPPDEMEWYYKNKPETLYRYLALDCYYTAKLAPAILSGLKEEGQFNVWQSRVRPGGHALRDIELTGARLDLPYLDELHERYQKDLKKLNQEILDIVNALNPQVELDTFNPGSPKQVAWVLYDLYQMKPVPRMGRSTAEPVLDKLPKNEFTRALLKYRELKKLDSTYVVGLAKRAVNGRVYPDFRLHGTVTGRLACRNPNLQNIPRVEEGSAGAAIRAAFIATEGFTLINADYSQLELRIAAQMSGDKNLATAFINGEDIHRQVAADALYHIPPEQITKDQRHQAKYVNFGMVYGRGAKSLAEGELNCSVAEARRFQNDFFATYSQLREWMHHQEELANKQGYVESLFGRRRRFPLITNQTYQEVARQSFNAPIQSSASDVCLGALIRICELCNSACYAGRVRVIITVHDSILLECLTELVAEIIPQLKAIMEDVSFADIFPYIVDVEVGQRWGDLKSWEKVQHEYTRAS